MTAVNLPIGAVNSGSNDWSDVHGEDQAIADVVNGNIDNTNVKASAGIVDSKLASPNNSVYKTLLTAHAVDSDSTGTTRWFATGAATGLQVASSPGAGFNPCKTYLRATDLAVTGLTTKVRLQVMFAVGTTPQSVTFTFGLYPITAMSGTSFTVGAALGTVALAAPTTGTLYQPVGSDITLPADGWYALGYAVSGATATPWNGYPTVSLQTRNV